ncbi:MAG: RsmB/NOP family class I SAM-dependent RNA methyltransferase, partial [Caulobacterales bacterium]|nr:RsmB/NOP family class I SAM-dependent RNA methyltransferase [Caulobacterales bacterium]
KILTENPFPIIDDILLLPNAWRSRLISTYGEEKTREIARSSLKQAPIDLTIKTNLSKEEIEEIINEFGGELIGDTSIRIPNLPEGFQEFPSWKSGKLWVQDLAASLPAKILAPQKGEEVLDMCAAPGGKTMQLAGSFAKVTAIDISDDRMKMVAQNLARTGLYAKLLSGNAKNLIEGSNYDAILLDAPCSATGTIRRNLESLWIKTAFDLPKLFNIQAELLTAAASALKPNGRLIYAVCSLEPEEGDLAINKALELGLKIDPIKADEIFGLNDAIEDRGTARIMPYMMAQKGGMDGFFIARFIKA